MRLFFHLLYHPLAWAYDLVAWVVSRGRWRSWILAAVPFIPAGPAMELGSGPGHLMSELSRLGLPVVGIDASRQMIYLARRKLQLQSQVGWVSLVHAQGQAVPFASRSFASVVATFPAPYIALPQTLAEIRRVLFPGGRLVILLGARITGSGLVDRGLRLLYRVTGETPTQNQINQLYTPFIRSGFRIEHIWVDLPGSQLLFLIATSEPDER